MLKVLGLGALALLAGCSATPKYIAISKETQAKIATTDVYLVEPKKTLTATIERSNITTYTGGGLLFALIDSAIDDSREEDAKKDIANIQRHMAKINVQDTLNTRLVPVFQNAKWLKVRNIAPMKVTGENTLKAKIDRTSAGAILNVYFTYYMDPDFTLIRGNLFVTLYATGDFGETIEKGAPIFKTEVSTVRSLENVGKNRQENCALWERGSGVYLKRVIEDIVQDLVHQLEHTLKTPDQEEIELTSTERAYTPYSPVLSAL